MNSAPARFLAFLLCAVLALTAVACTPGDETSGVPLPQGPSVIDTTVPIGDGAEVSVSEAWTVTVPGTAAPPDATMTVAATAASGDDHEISRADLTLSSGQPAAPLTFTYRFDDPVPADTEVVFLGIPSGSSPDDPTSASATVSVLSADRRSATAEISHLTNFGVYFTDANHFLTQAAGLRTHSPTCESQPRPEWLEAPVFLEGKDSPMLVCVGSDPGNSDTAVVKIRNNRGVAMIVTAPVTPAWAHQEAFSGSLAAMMPNLLAKGTDSLGIPASERSRTWVLPPGSGVDIGFTEASFSGRLATKITTRISTASVAYGLIWQEMVKLVDDPTALTALEMGVMGVCAADSATAAVTAADAAALVAGLSQVATCAIEHAPDIVGEISGHIPDAAWNELQSRHQITKKIASLRTRLLPLLTVAQYTVVIGDTLSTLALGSGAYEIGLFIRIGADAGLKNLCGTIDEKRTVKHPEIGSVTIGLSRDGQGLGGRGCVAVVDRTGKKLLQQTVAIYDDELRFADPITDATGNAFLTYNPGRYNGVITLVPNASGYEEIGWQHDDLGYETTTHAYYSAELEGPGGDGRYVIKSSANNCEPSCADGTITTTTLRWNGSTYS